MLDISDIMRKSEAVAVAIGLRWGQLLTGIEDARAALSLAQRGADHLSADEKAALVDITERLCGIEQAAWARLELTRAKMSAIATPSAGVTVVRAPCPCVELR